MDHKEKGRYRIDVYHMGDRSLKEILKELMLTKIRTLDR